MLKNDFFSVKNLKGEMPLNRAIRYNLTSLIRQSVLFSESLSGVHLDNQIVGSVIDIIANKVYTRVGIGISMNKTSYPYQFIVTFDFTIRDLVLSPPDPVQLEKFRQSVIKVLIEKNPNIRSENKQLSADIKTWFTQNTEYKSEDLEFFLSKKWGSSKQIKVWTRDVFYYQL